MLRVLITALLLAAPPAAAQTAEGGTYDVRLGGFRVGVLAFSALEDRGRYSAAAQLESSGLAAFVREVGYEARSAGRINDGRYVPENYWESTNTGERISRAVMEYRNGVPQVKSYDPPEPARPTDVDPATQGGTLDPMTAIFALLRDVPRDQVCRVSLQIFDGRRKSALATAAPEVDGDRIRCNGEYRRIAGYSPRQMEERTRFGFRLTYAPAGGDKWRVVRVTLDTLYGRASLERR